MTAAGPAGDDRPDGSGPGTPAEGEGDGARRTPAGGEGGTDPSEEAVRFWYRRHGDRVFRYARWRTGSREAAEEVVSDVFVEAWRSAADYDADEGSVESWLLGIARNVIRRLRRRWAREAERRGPGELEDLEASGPGPDEQLLRRERSERLMEAVWALPERDRDLVALAYGAELSRRRMAELLETTPEAVRTRLHRVLERLRETLDRDG